MGDFAGARLAFQSIPCDLSNPLPFRLSQLQLAKVFLAEGSLNEALQTLVQLYLPIDDPLCFERTYLIGWIHQSRGDHLQAAECFESLLPKTTPKTTNWALILEGAITANLSQTLSDCTLGTNVLAANFSKIEPLLEQLVSESPNERSFLLLSDFYFIKAKSLEDGEAYAKAVRLLDEKKFVISPEKLQQSLLKQAAAAPTHQERSLLYEQLCNEKSYPPSLKAKAFFFLGLNDFEEGIACQRRRQQNLKVEDLSQEIHLLENAARSFAKSTLPEASLYLALVFAHLPGDANLRRACQTLDQLLITGNPLSTLENPEKLYCLYAWTSLRLLDAEQLREAKRAIEQISHKDIIDPFWKGQCLKLHALLSLQLSLWKEAEQILASLLSDDLLAPLHGEALFWLAYSKDKQQLYPLKIELLKQAYTSYPKSPYAPAAYFYIYSYREYMQGTRKAIKHLQRLPLLFPDHPLAVSAHYLIGLYCKKDHLSEEGKILQRKSWTAAIDAFQEAESTFDALLKKNLIPQADLAFYTQLRYRSQLERAVANLAIAQISTSGKKQIYLEYAESVFNALIHDFTASNGVAKTSSYPKLLANAQFQLAKTLEEKKEWNKAEAILDDSLERYRQGAQVQGIGLMRVWQAKGKLARLLGSESQALECFLEAEKAVQGLAALNANEKLDLWIQQSLKLQRTQPIGARNEPSIESCQ